MSNQEARAAHAAQEITDAAQGIAPKVYGAPAEIALDVQALGADMKHLYGRIRSFVNACHDYIRKEDVPLNVLGGILKNVRALDEGAVDIHRLLDSGQKPASLRDAVEVIMATKMAFTAATTGKSCTVEAYGKRFVVSVATLPTIPSAKRDPAKFNELLEFLRSIGRGDMIKPGQDLSYRELCAVLEGEVQNPTKTMQPWPDWLKVSVVPTIRMSDIPT